MDQKGKSGLVSDVIQYLCIGGLVIGGIIALVWFAFK